MAVTDETFENSNLGAQARLLTARRIRVRNLAVHDRHWLRGEPFATAFFNALSAVFPIGETFMIESLRPWQKMLTGKLADDVKTFIEQEAAHSREHSGMNRALIRAGYDIAPLDRAIRQFVTFFAKTSDTTKLGATMCIEHLTAIVAAEILHDETHLRGAETELHRLWLWHAIEEVEHKAVAFDVWMHVTRDWSPARRWLTRSAMMVGVTASFFVNRTRGQIELLRQDGIAFPRALAGAIRYGFAKGGIGRRVFGSWAKFLKPGFHPWQIDDHALIAKGEQMVAAFTPVEASRTEPVKASPAPVAKAA
jgi:uncharacterized protein